MKSTEGITEKTNSIFDHVIQSKTHISEVSIPNLASLIFNRLDHRPENSHIILSHSGSQLVDISLKRLRWIVYSIYLNLDKKGIKSGNTVLLASISGNNELFIALMFLALSSYGIRVLMPMFMEVSELAEWIQNYQCDSMILPEKEINSLSHHTKEKRNLKSAKEIAEQKKLPCFDLEIDFHLSSLLFQPIPTKGFSNDAIVKDVLSNTNHQTEALLITTSGSSGKSKVVVYEQGAFIRSCQSWQDAGFFDEDLLGGVGFTPLFTHTMGVRAFINALWTGVPVCLIISDWFLEKPETVRYFLMNMKPQHITGGPAVYNLLLELMRYFPELKILLRSHLKTLISSGTPISEETLHSIEAAFGLKVHNAFGMTETQQVLSTLLIDSLDESAKNILGLPLPGVVAGLTKVDNTDNQYKLFIKSPFGGKLENIDGNGRSNAPLDFFDTGDIVQLQKNDLLYFLGRENRDFLNDAFGVKIPLNDLQNYYSELYHHCTHIEYFPLQNIPGLAALIFVDEESMKKGSLTSSALRTKILGKISEINNKLYQELEPFEYLHRHIARITLINAAPPITVKGNISRYKIEAEYKEIILSLIDHFSPNSAVINTENELVAKDKFSRYNNPLVGQMLSALGIDYIYHKAQKDSLYTFINGEETEILDLVGGYGSNLLGHNNKEIKQAAAEFLENDEISLSDQGSVQNNIGVLAENLNADVSSVTGRSYNVMFGSTGSEAVEMAIHHALYEWRMKLEDQEAEQLRKFSKYNPGILAEVQAHNKAIIDNAVVSVVVMKDAFHGNSTTARSLIGNRDKRAPFLNLLSVKPIYLDDTVDNWQEINDKQINNAKVKLKKFNSNGSKPDIREVDISTTIAAIIEPVIGEGGVRLPGENVLPYFSKYEFPLIADEIQCGLGRTGKFLASGETVADYYLLGKSLGGGIGKISAILIDKSRYQKDFGKYYVSTFANGGLAARIALKSLSIIRKDRIPEKVKQMGEIFRDKLIAVKESYPQFIDKITGQGLMLGIRFSELGLYDSFLLRVLQERDLLGYLFSAFLLRQHKIRILPTLSAPNILRIEPSAYVTEEEIEIFIKALEDLLENLKNNHIYQILKCLMDGDPFTDNKNYKPEQGKIPTSIEAPLKGATSVAFIIHYAYPLDELRMLESSLISASDTGLRILLNSSQILMEMKPVTVFTKNICQGRIHFQTILIPVDSAEMERLHRQNKRKTILNRIQEAVDMAAENGAKIISLGGFTSILSCNGTKILEPENTMLITGNTLTAAAGIEKLKREIKQSKVLAGEKVLSIVGATGNIGSIITEHFTANDLLFNKIFLIGRNQNRLELLVKEIHETGRISKNVSIEIATDLTPLKRSNVIIAMTNSNDPIIFPDHLSQEHPVYISDLSIPSALSAEIRNMNNVKIVPFTSYVSLPEDPDFVLSSCSPKGTVLCCAGESILCGLDKVNSSLKGKITVEGIQEMTLLAKKHDLLSELGDVRNFKGVLTDE